LSKLVLDLSSLLGRGDHFRFRSIFINKKITKSIKKNRNRTKTGSNRLVSVRFGFLGQKPVQTGLSWFFSGLARVFLFGFGSVRFFRFQAYKTETEPVGFFKILIGFFHDSIFSVQLLLFFNIIGLAIGSYKFNSYFF